MLYYVYSPPADHTIFRSTNLSYYDLLWQLFGPDVYLVVLTHSYMHGKGALLLPPIVLLLPPKSLLWPPSLNPKILSVCTVNIMRN